MRRIRSKDTVPELTVRSLAHALGFRYRLHRKDLPGSPDLVFPRLKRVIFVHGCFWHGHEGCKYFVIPKTRTEWWEEKIKRNKQLDSDNFFKLTTVGWKVYIIFECDLKKLKYQETMSQLLNYLNTL